MKVKYSVIPFIPVAIVMSVFKLMGIFGLDGNGLFLGMNKMGLTYTVIGIGLGLFVLCILINLFDRKTAPVYPVRKNYPAAAFAVLSGILIIASAVTKFMNTTANSEYYFMTIACLIFAIPAGLALVLMARTHFVGKSNISTVSMLFIFPALWGCAELVSEFLVATKVSISATDLTALFCYIFITLFMFSCAMVLSRIQGRNPVKACFIYGLPAIAISVAEGLGVICTSLVEGIDVSQILMGIEFIVISLYALSFIMEMTIKSYTKDEIEIIDGMPEDNDEDVYANKYTDTSDYDDLVMSHNPIDDIEPGDEIPSEFIESMSDIDDFILGYDKDEDSDTASGPVATDDSPIVLNTAEGVTKSSSSNDSKESLSEIDQILQDLENKK